MLPAGAADGGHGVPDGLVPAVLGVVPGLLPGFGVVGEEPGFDVCGFVEPLFGLVVLGGVGVVGHGVVLGVIPGLLGVVVLPGGGGKFAPGIAPGVVALGGVVGVVPLGVVDPGVVCRACGVAAVPAGGVAVVGGGVAVPAGGVAAPGEL